ncbi:MAG: hypothetical protein NDJ90_07615 [Oligoflexia bacterium]|nr:hypothetical protein [Oligoflexia bacterium]
MIVIAISGVSMLGLMQMMTYMNRTQKNASMGVDFTNLASQIQLTIQNEKVCQSSLTNVPFQPSGPSEITMNLQGTPLAAGSVVSGWNMNSVTLVGDGSAPVATIGTDKQYLAKLSLAASKKDVAASMGAPMKFINFPVYVLVNASNKVVSCFGQDGNLALTCQSLGGNFQPAANPPCQMPLRTCAVGQVVKGTNPDGSPICMTLANQACPAGQVMSGLNADGTLRCQIPPTAPKACAAGQMVTGVNADGSLQCATVTVVGGSCSPPLVANGINSDGSVRCAQPTITGGSCPAGTVASGISANGTVTCSQATVVGGACAAGYVATGIASNGAPVCTKPPATGGQVCSPNQPCSGLCQSPEFGGGFYPAVGVCSPDGMSCNAGQCPSVG